MTESECRLQLQSITTGRSADEWPVLIEDLRARYPHSIRALPDPGPRHFNCFAFAVDLVHSESYLAVAVSSHAPNVFANFQFIQYLLSHAFLEPESCESSEDALIIYFDRHEPTHAGLLRHGRVTSKWGTGQYFEHALFEVPHNYGARVACFQRPDPSVCEAAFLEFARYRGVDLSEFIDS